MASSTPTTPAWLEISLQADPILHDPLSSFLFDLGCSGIVSEDFQDRTLRAYLPLREDLEAIRARTDIYLQNLKEIFPAIPSPVIHFSQVEDQNWGLAWRRFFHPARVTSGLLILPAWESIPRTDAPHVIRMDPGPAFGTGQHPTTRMCLEAMERVSPKGHWTLLDVGTGSGILAIYGALLGAEKVLAIDTDPEAIRWAEENIRLNEAATSIELSLERVETVRNPFSLICANLILGEILRLMPFFPGLMTADARLILSGILEDQVPQVAQSLSAHGMQQLEILHEGEWACVVAARRPWRGV